MQGRKEKRWLNCEPALTVSIETVSLSGYNESPSVPTAKPQFTSLCIP